MATSSNDEFRDALIRHQTYLLRLGAGVRNKMQALLNKSEEEMASKIRDKLRNTEGIKSPADVARMEKLLQTIENLRSESWKDAKALFIDEMVDLSKMEPQFLAGIIQTVSPVVIELVLPPARQLKGIVTSRPFDGLVLKDWAAGMERDDIRRIHGAIQMGMVQGESSAAIARRVIGTEAFKGSDGVTAYTRRQVESITRTAVQHIANSVRDDFMQENADVITSEMFVATLDARTTAICKANDGKIFPVGKGPKPPLHFGCRSLRVAHLDGVVLGDRPYKSSTTKQLLREFTEQNKLPKVSSRDDLPKGTKSKYDSWSRKRIRELTGQVPRSETYQSWLKRQTNTFQEDTLGVTKAKLFRDGNLTLDKFVAADGRELSLSELATKHASAFRAAGLDPSGF